MTSRRFGAAGIVAAGGGDGGGREWDVELGVGAMGKGLGEWEGGGLRGQTV